MMDFDMHSYIPMKYFHSSEMSMTEASKLFCATVDVYYIETRPWNEIREIVDKVHKHVCGNASYSDTKVLLERIISGQVM